VSRAADNTELPGRGVTWSSSDPSVAAIDPATGGITTVGPGTVQQTVTITATSTENPTISGTATLVVNPVPVASVSVTLTPPSPIIAGQSSQATAVSRAVDNTELPGRGVTWSSSNEAVATIDANGAVTTIAAGTTTITATSAENSAITGQAALEILAPVASVSVSLLPASPIVAGRTTTATAISRDAAGTELPSRSVTWHSSDTDVATIDPGTGIVTTLNPGNATIIATSEENTMITGQVALTVLAAVATVTVTLAESPIVAGWRTNAIAVSRDAAGNQLSDRPVTWSSSQTNVATVDQTTGEVVGLAPGTTDIVAISQENTTISGQTTLPVLAPVALVRAVLGDSTILAAASTFASALLFDAAGNALTNRVVRWSSIDPAIATVDAHTGLVTGISAGTSQLIAVVEGLSDTVAITVVTTTVGPADPTMLPQATGQQPLAGTYGRNLEAGQTYTDPLTGVTVLKLTGATVPAANLGVYHGYSEGGPSISQPWVGADGHVYYTAHIANSWLVDIRYDTFTPTNWRPNPAHGEIAFAFSLHPATPRIAYIITDFQGKRVERFNTATNQIENTGRWPWQVGAAGEFLVWLQTNLNDSWLVAYVNSAKTTVGFRPSDGFEREITSASAGQISDEPHLDREFPIVYLSHGPNQPVMQQVANLETGAVTNPSDPQGINSDSHTATLRGRAVAVTWPGDGIVETNRHGVVRMAVTNPSPVDWGGDSHLAGQWVFNNPNDYFIIDQWLSNNNYPIRQGMIGFVSATTGDKRVLVAHDAVGSGYDTGGQPHPTISPDGKLVMWTSNMNNSGRYDIFVARVPTR
jgi:uncharacterized protein YjdB